MLKPQQKLTALLLVCSLFPCAVFAKDKNKDQPDDEISSYEFNGKIRARYDQFDALYSNNGEQQTESYVRRVDLGVNGTFLQKLDYEFEVKFDREGKASVKTAEVDYHLPFNTRIALGRFDPDFGLELSGSSTWVTGIERSAIWDLAPYVGEGKDARGIALRQNQKHYFASLGVFDTPNGTTQDARLVYAPIQRNKHLLHLGYSYAKLSDPKLIDGEIKTDLSVWSLGFSDNGNSTKLARAVTPGSFAQDATQAFELAYMRGAFSLQAEYLQREFGGTNGQADRTTTGHYVQLAYTLTGEVRDYSIKTAKFGTIKPHSSAGAWEIFARKDVLETQGETGLLSHKRNQGNAELSVVGINWYSPERWKISANYLQGETINIANDIGDTQGKAISLQVQARF